MERSDPPSWERGSFFTPYNPLPAPLFHFYKNFISFVRRFLHKLYHVHEHYRWSRTRRCWDLSQNPSMFQHIPLILFVTCTVHSFSRIKASWNRNASSCSASRTKRSRFIRSDFFVFLFLFPRSFSLLQPDSVWFPYFSRQNLSSGVPVFHRKTRSFPASPHACAPLDSLAFVVLDSYSYFRRSPEASSYCRQRRFRPRIFSFQCP